jgi:hypothetical protein
MTPLSARYRFEAPLGEGGMALVHRVLDIESGRRVALKRLRAPADGGDRESAIALFEREFLTLAQLAHPRVVEAYDYGIDEEGPYYTMELLDGGDLQGLAPVPWLKACLLARDVCSALALLHSRRMVYRDLSPRNVRCTSDGMAKLIDFGAMTSMGVSCDVVGTPPYVAPEALNLQPLDGRTDLYALGATLYYTLVQRHAYPARDFGQLRDLWRSRPRRPSELVADIPDALDCLVMDLIHLDPAVRPGSAAEVMARLSAIAGQRSSEQLLVTQAYLSNPMLVGRETQLAAVRKLAWRTLHRRGASLVIRGSSGIGRSRFLDACVLEAKLAGLLVVRLGAGDRQSKNFGVVRALASQLLRSARALAVECAEPHLGVLGRVIPELLEERTDIAVDPVTEPQELQRKTHGALQQWLLQICRKRSLMIATDDLGALDDASAAFLALLAQGVSEHGLLLATTAERGADESVPMRSARALLESASTLFEFEPLTLAECEELLGSVFGDPPHLAGLASYLHRVSAGNPRDIMQLAQHLVSENVIRYSGGTWSLPVRLSEAALPASMADALRHRVAKLDVHGVKVALALALEPTQRFTFEECGVLGLQLGSRQLTQALEELMSAEVTVASGRRYGLRQQAWTGPLLGASSPGDVDRAHAALASVFERRGEHFRSAQHLLFGGERERGLDALVKHAVDSKRATDASAQAYFEHVQSVPRNWLGTYEHALSLCDQLGRPAKQRAALLERMEAIIGDAISESSAYRHIQSRLDQLERECGLDIYQALPDDLDPGERLRRALGAAQARFDQLPEDARVLAPTEAIKQLVQSALSAIGAVSFTHDYVALRRLPSLVPLIPLSPAIGIVAQVARGVGARITGRHEEAFDIYSSILQQLDASNGAGISRGLLGATKLRLVLSLATMEATMGRPSCLGRIAAIEQERSAAGQAMLIRYLYYVWQGDRREAARCKRQAEVLLIESRAHNSEGQHLFSELCAFALADDMTRVRRTTDAVEPRAIVHSGWLPVLHYGRGEYQRIRGDHVGALSDLETALSLIHAGEHQIWPSAAGARLRVLNELGRHEDVLAIGETYLSAADGARLGYVRNYIRMPLAAALSKLGRSSEATALADAVIEDFQRLGTTGLNLASAFEVRARVALDAEDQESFESFARLCAEQWPAGEKRLLGAKYQRVDDVRSGEAEQLADRSMMSLFMSTLEKCESSAQRAGCGLEFLARQSGAVAGLLYILTDDGLKRVSSFGEALGDRELDHQASAYFARELDHDEHTEAHGEQPMYTDATDAKWLSKRGFVPVLLTHQSERGVAMAGVALLAAGNEARFAYPGRVAAELSRALAHAGDVVIAYG